MVNVGEMKGAANNTNATHTSLANHISTARQKLNSNSGSGTKTYHMSASDSSPELSVVHHLVNNTSGR